MKSQTVFFTDFNNGVPSQFSGIAQPADVQWFNGIGTGNNIFSGNFLRNNSGGDLGGGTGAPQIKTTLTLTGLPNHTSIDLNFLLAVIDSWDGFAPTAVYTPDIFNVTVDGNSIFAEGLDNYDTFNDSSPNPPGDQTYIPPTGVFLGGQNYGFNSFADTAYNLGLDPTFNNIAHTANTLTVEWFASGAGWEGDFNESWGIDNVEVILNIPLIEGDDNNNLLNGTSNEDEILGLGGNDTLNGLAGNDTLDGGTGSDFLNGGIGNDIYLVDNPNDIVQETSTISSEIDKVESSISFTLGNNLENLTLTGTANLQGKGNSLNNLITGNSSNNLLDGSTGSDTLVGGTGNDTYLVDNANDVVQETNTITSEIDNVESNISYTLGTNLENLTLTGTANLQGTGNNLNNRMIGNSGNNFLSGGTRNDILSGSWGNDTLDGGTGNDTLNGGNGNDTYVIGNLDDVIQETNTATSQIDTVESTISYTLGTNLENLILTGNEQTDGNGNSLNNAITGNDGDNIINGGVGYDTLTGGLGNDSFRFNSNLAVDRIVDFTSNSDKIVLSKATFTAITSNSGTGFSNASEFATVTNYTEAESSAALIVYNTTNDRLFYNQNGTAAGFGSGAAFAELLNNANLVASDFTIIA